MSYIDITSLAQLANVSRQAIEKAIKGIADGRSSSWRGQRLEIRTFHGRGGRSGLQYQVKVSSLPEHLQERLKALQTHAETASTYRLAYARLVASCRPLLRV